jgi:hypothetical protein
MNAKQIVSQLIESPIGDVERKRLGAIQAKNGTEHWRQDQDAHRELKGEVRGDMFHVVKEYFPDAEETGKFSVNFTHNGQKFQIRMRSEGLRISGGMNFVVSSFVDREKMLRWICLSIALRKDEEGK